MMENLQHHFDIAFDAPEGLSKLRELILTLAVQGKLVEQDPEDTPARELVKQIAADKQRFVEQGSIRQSRPLRPIDSNETPYAIPESWMWARLGEIMLKITDGTHHSPSNSDHGDFLYISAKNIKDSGVQLSNATYVTREVHEEIFSRCNPERGDILYIKDGATTGIVTINQLDEPFSMLSSVALLKQPPQVSNHYLLFALKAPYFYNAVRSGMTGVAITRVTLSKLQDAMIPLPPFAEQLRIVSKVRELMARCATLEELCAQRDKQRLTVHTAVIRKLLNVSTENGYSQARLFIGQHFAELYIVRENVNELRRAILQLAIMGKLVPQNHGEPPASKLLELMQTEMEQLIESGEIRKPKVLTDFSQGDPPFRIPGTWEWVRLGNLGISQTGATPPSDDEDNYGEYIPFIGPGDIKDGTINYSIRGLSRSGMSAARLIKANSLLMVCIGGSIGKHAVNDRDITCNQQINTLTPYQPLPIRFIYWLTASDWFQRAVLDCAGGSATPIINKQKWCSILVPLPPLQEALRIVKKIDQLMSMCDSLDIQIEAASRTQVSLLNSIMARFEGKQCA